MDKQYGFEEFHRGYQGGAKAAAIKIIQHIQTPIDYNDLKERVMQVLRDQMDIDLMAERDCSDCGEQSGCEVGQVFCRWPINKRCQEANG